MSSCLSNCAQKLFLKSGIFLERPFFPTLGKLLQKLMVQDHEVFLVRPSGGGTGWFPSVT